MQARLLESREIAPATRHFVFELPEVEQFNFVPGQFVSFHADINGQTITRAYSIASAPAGNRFELWDEARWNERRDMWLKSEETGTDLPSELEQLSI